MPDPAVLDDLLPGERHAIEDVFSEAEAAAAIEQALAAWDVIIPAGHRLDYDVSDRGRDLELVGCVEPSSDDTPIPDPCEWRHTWLYRVQLDDSVTLLFEEGDPDPMAAE